ncbi:MAG: 4Fe-4S binding protein [Syntrophobacteraceae bacterium]|nr:4Fe-4S binding protein [Syntrophobacteraceae bacterium]
MAQPGLSEKCKRAAEIICRLGLVPLPATETAVEIVSRVVGQAEEELDLIASFRENPSQTLAQLVASSGFAEGKILPLATSLAGKGLLFNQPGSSGVMVYRLLPFFMVGLMEYKFMGPLTGSPEEKELALLFEKLLSELRDLTQANYDSLAPVFAAAPPLDRTVCGGKTADGKAIRIIAVDKSMGVCEEFILPSQSVEEIIDKFDDIAVGNCFCRQRRNLLGEVCKTNAPVQNCFSFGKSARHTSSMGFARKITREEALKILGEARKAGLVHKAFHPAGRPSSPETSICNCCKDCCDTFRIWRNGTLPMINSTCYLAIIDPDACTGCGTCAQWCPTDAISINEDGLAQRLENACLGCGVCAGFCPQSAISMKQGLRRVFVMPPRLRNG